MKTDFYATLTEQKKLMVYELQYGANQAIDSSFQEGYAVKNKKVLNKAAVKAFSAVLSDSANFIKDKSQNCVLAANYGFKLKNDSANYIVFIGNAPCLKMLIVNQTKNTEVIYDLQESNTITAYLKKLFQ